MNSNSRILLLAGNVRFGAYLALTLTALWGPVDAQQNECAAAAANVSGNDEEPASCYCGADLSAIKGSFPDGFKLVAACNLRMLKSGSVDLKSQSVNIDSDSDLPMADLYFSGDVQLSGQVRVEPNEIGALWFYVQSTRKASPILSQLRLKKRDYRKFDAPEPNYSINQCASAPATIVIHNLKVVLSDGDEQGAYPISIDVVKVGRFAQCQK